MTKSKDTNPELQLALFLSKDIPATRFKRFLHFRNENGIITRLPMRFRKQEGQVFLGKQDPDSNPILRQLCQPGNRSAWDSVWLENRRGKVPLSIDEVELVMDYSALKGAYPGKITLIKGKVGRHLGKGVQRIDLTPAMISFQYSQNQIDLNGPEVLRYASRDIGKFGSDGPTEKEPDNPKYGLKVKQGAPSFAAWYYHYAQLRIGRRKFSRKRYGDELLNFFQSCKRLASWHPSKGAFVNQHHKKIVAPQPGDYLVSKRKKEGGMIVLDWDPQSRLLKGITGPFPVMVTEIQFVPGKKVPGYFLGSI